MNIISFNVNGLNQNIKRQVIFEKIQKLNCIAFLQETHSSKDVENLWKNEIQGKIFFSHGTSNTTGVCIFIPQNIDYEIEDKICDEEGRIIILKVLIDKIIYILCNIYAPTRDHKCDQINFIKKLKNMLIPYENQNLLVGGDFNFYLDPKLDKLDSMSNRHDNPIYRSEILSLLDFFYLNDAWRTLFPSSRRYTWHSRGKSSRLDYWFLSNQLLNSLQDYKILPGLHSDHSILKIQIGNTSIPRGKGFWKFNSKLLNDTYYVKNIKEIISTCKYEYANQEDKGLTWEMVKLKIRSFSVPYCISKKKERAAFKKELEAELTNLQTEIDLNNNTNARESFESSKKKLEELEKEEINSIIFRSKIQWVEEGEKNTKFFLNLEKKNYTNKLISNLEIGGIQTADQEKITKEQLRFYSTLYSEKLKENDKNYLKAMDFFHKEIECPKLSEIQKNFCDNDINETEILINLKGLKNGKTPGSDGLPPEFYKFFWIDIKILVTDSIQYALNNNRLSIEQKRGIITLLPKKSKNRIFLKNWRPISLLNTDYKLISKILASRLQQVLPDIINVDQSGYLKNRYIGENIRLLQDVCFFTEKNNLPGLIFCIDFEKAFDTLNWNFLFKSLETFNFGNKFIEYIKTLYNNIESTIINNGKTCEFFKLERGVRQGCPLSAYLFIIAIEILAIHIRNDPDITGIKIGKEEIKISLLADDITLLLKDLFSLNHVLKTLNLFQHCSGLKINLDKSKAKYIGSLLSCDHFPHGLSWIKKPIETLGITIVYNSDLNFKYNFQQKIANLKTTLQIWKQRNLSLKGKTIIINSIALAPLIYISSIVDTPKKAITEINNIIQNFIWNGSTKISQKTLIQDTKQGGLKLCHFQTKVDAIKLTWVKRLTSNTTHKWKIIPKQYYNSSNLNIYFNSNHKILTKQAIPTFYLNIHNIYMKYFKKESNNIHEILDQSLWYNENLKINKDYIYLRNWESAGINTIRDLLSDYGTFFNISELNKKYDLNINFLQLLQVQNCIPKAWKQQINNAKLPLPKSKTEIIIHIGDNNKPMSILKCKDFYWYLININKHIPTSVQKWHNIYKNLNSSIDNKWNEIYKLNFSIARDTKLQSFQYKINHRIIACNYWLKQIKIKNTNLCNYCNTQIDTIQHFLIQCHTTKQFWNSFTDWWNRTSENSTNLPLLTTEIDEKNILFGFPGGTEKTTVLNYCISYAKYFIYRQKMNTQTNIDLHSFLPFLKHNLEIEKMINLKNDTEHKFRKFKTIYECL